MAATRTLYRFGFWGDEAYYNDDMQDVNEWEKTKASGKNNSCMPEKVEAFAADEIEIASVVGYLWPIPVYRRVKNAEPHENNHQIQTVDGRKVVVLDSSHGTPETVAGVERMMKKRRVGVARTGRLADTEDGCSADSLAQAQKAGQLRVGVKAVRRPMSTNWPGYPA